MGTDIHYFVEQKMYRHRYNDPDRSGKWISIDKWTKSSWAILYPERDESPTWIVESNDMVFKDRNYDLFAILANIRNPENMPYISEPRGLPEDVSEEIRLQIEYGEFHSTTWFTAKELLEFNWDQVFEYEDETMDGEVFIDSVNYMECGSKLLDVVRNLVGRKEKSDFRIIITFDC
ncbi:hypothetical protein H1230_21455 [Paenibacillus sp. 19GGS1-52]|uniref:hypothetical protein n=1 Tax=Paenibacillus sp. 19GGS1-52 TaxID=2758563 RepID=UPI001EFA8AEB|nr:hypothetical protein [Paenibacillus sp. 19GGS1-52]ULO05624.1 hypothetical protein H1230_21455 [Paenibacillus sp. 19GGS1-52]